MSAISATRAGRRAAESLMTDTCTITRAGDGERVFDDETGQYTDPDRVIVYSGKCRVQVNSVIGSPSDSDAGERQAVEQDSALQLPIVGSEGVAVNDVARIDTCSMDAALVDREFTIVARHEKSHATSRRLRVTEVTG